MNILKKKKTLPKKKKKYLFRLKMSHLTQLFLGLCAYNLKQSSETIFFDHRKEHACTPDGPVQVPVSTTPPLNETDYNAVNFSLWKKLGRQILIKSNINNWLVCDPGNGSLVDWQYGDINCTIIKHVTSTCKDTPAPSVFDRFPGSGPIFFDHVFFFYYYFDTLTEYGWPVHDPCGKSEPNQLNGVAEPHGNIFIR